MCGFLPMCFLFMVKAFVHREISVQFARKFRCNSGEDLHAIFSAALMHSLCKLHDSVAYKLYKKLH